MREEKETRERMTEDIPWEIKALYEMPYCWVKNLNLPGKYLDVGGGSQRLGKKLLSATDIDIEPECHCDFTGDAISLPFADKSFDYALCFEVIEHVTLPLHLLDELIRVTRKKIFLGTSNKTGSHFIFDRMPLWLGRDNPYHVKEYSAKQFRRLLAGLDASFYSSVCTIYPVPGFAIVRHNDSLCIVNYAIITVPNYIS